jgi:hypothetical protein
MQALIAFASVILPMVGMVALMFLLGGADPSTAAPDAVEVPACSSCCPDDPQAS